MAVIEFNSSTGAKHYIPATNISSVEITKEDQVIIRLKYEKSIFKAKLPGQQDTQSFCTQLFDPQNNEIISLEHVPNTGEVAALGFRAR